MIKFNCRNKLLYLFIIFTVFLFACVVRLRWAGAYYTIPCSFVAWLAAIVALILLASSEFVSIEFGRKFAFPSLAALLVLLECRKFLFAYRLIIYFAKRNMDSVKFNLCV